MTTTGRSGVRGDRAEGWVLVAILLLVAGFAGAASFTHVKDWTLANSPSGTPVWFGWANAVISELVPVAAGLTIRRRRRTHAPVGYPLALLIAAAGLSLAAQLAVAKPGPSGWLLAAVPALAFMALVKLVLAPTAAIATAATASPTHTREATALADVGSTSAVVSASTPAPATPAAINRLDQGDALPAQLVSAARMITVQHRQTSDQPLTADGLAARLNTTPAVATRLQAVLDTAAPASVSAGINGHTVSLDGVR
jgi:disulfide bond formation protein DsbB